MSRTRSLLKPLHFSLGLKPHEGDDAEKLLQAKIAAAVEAATGSLKTNRDTILEEKKALKAQFDATLAQLESLGGAEGIKKLATQREEMRKTEEGKLLTDGKYDEWLKFKTEAMTKDHQKQLNAAAEATKTLQDDRDSVVQRLHRKTLRVDVSTARAEAKTLDLPGVQEDILNAAEKVFTYDAELDAMVIKDKEGIVNGKDGKSPKTMLEWLNEQQESRRHWWGDTVGGGAGGSKRPGGGFDKNPWSPEHWNVTRQGEAIKQRGEVHAAQMAAAAGSRIGGTRPMARKT